MAAEWNDYYTPETILTHGFINIDGKKISKSVKSLKDISLDELLLLTGSSDSLRHYLLSNISFGKDGNFDESLLIDSHNSSLVKNFGNLIQRVLSIKAKFPVMLRFVELETNLNDIDKAFISDIESKFSEIKDHWKKFEINEAVTKTFLVSSLANKYVDQTAPWVCIKEKNIDRLEMILKVLLGAFKCLNSFMAPILPQKSAELSVLLGETKPILFIDKVEINPLKDLPAPKHLFSFIETKK
jgi:methionyl-tRNA synthetase